jgi:hypothetical protein
MLGNATFTIVVSSSAMNAPNMTVAKTSVRLRLAPRSNPEPARSGAGEASNGSGSDAIAFMTPVWLRQTR